MSGINVKHFDAPDQTINDFKNAKIDEVKVGDQKVSRLTLSPGWKWSTDIKPAIGTESCQTPHLGVIVKGTMCIKHDDGTELTYSAGNAYQITPGHDGWVVGDEAAILYEFSGRWGNN